MANIFAIITAVLLAASAYLAFKNNEMYKDEISDRQSEESRLDTSRNRLTSLRTQRDDTIAERTGVEEDTVVKKDQEEKQKATNTGLQDDIDSKKSQVEDNARKIAEIEEQTKELGEISDIAAKIRRMKGEIASLEDEQADKEATLARLLGEKSSTEATISNYNTENEAITNQRSFFDSARISAIYAPWGFVTLNAGNGAGVVSGSSLDVVRDGETVAKLRVRSVESGRAAADVVPDSLSEDITLMVGDRVVPSAADEPAKPEPKEEAAEDGLSVD
ncbi:hypothetical protein HAHE_03950 [Haloferula helveola]|uniref:Uncharacterized protein n=1 Tax=Haloferula helveola TaxID=490095 RepID=A0ABM7R740_9BACT|nr:hypothetical protein HAHE_03950 [Haloferula helveola]